MTELQIEHLPPAPLHLLELWGDPRPAAARIAKVLGHALPPAGQSQGQVLRLSPTAWLIDGELPDLAKALGDDGALTSVGGGLVRLRFSGAGWRSLLMEGALFDAESPAFAPGCVATTLIEHVSVTLRVESDAACLAYVPASHAEDLLHFWKQAAVLV